MRRFSGFLAISLAFGLSSGQARADLTLIDSFAGGLGELASCGFDPTTDQVWVYGSSDATLSKFTRAGVALGTVTRPGESANDVDVTATTVAMTLGATPIPAGTVLFVNGESGFADVYAIDKSTGSILATLVTGFGVSHVVGGSYHAGRNTIFLVQDRVPSGTANDNLIAEIDVTTGAVLDTFATTAALATFTVNFGDVEVGANGNLFVVSSDETEVLELTPDGAFVQTLPLPVGVSSLSGIGLDHGRGEAWVSGTGGTVWHLGGFPPSLGRPVIALSEDTFGTTLVDWPAVPGATAYDVVRGSLATLRQTGGDFTASTTACLADNVATPPVQDSTPVGVGDAFWYLTRAVSGTTVGTYDEGSASQQGSRDAEIAASASSCP
jgi:hypothetical protein